MLQCMGSSRRSIACRCRQMPSSQPSLSTSTSSCSPTRSTTSTFHIGINEPMFIYCLSSVLRAGKARTSRICAAPHSSITIRSTPRPHPTVGGRPYSRAAQNCESISGTSSSLSRSCKVLFTDHSMYAHIQLTLACAIIRLRCSLGSLSSEYALQNSCPAMKSSKRCVWSAHQ